MIRNTLNCKIIHKYKMSTYIKKKKYSTKINYNRISYPINIMENCNDVKLKDDRKRDVSTTRRPLIHTLNITL